MTKGASRRRVKSHLLWNKLTKPDSVVYVYINA
jgi:hypothetical protein